MFVNRNRPFLRYVVAEDTGGSSSSGDDSEGKAPEGSDEPLGPAGTKALEAEKAKRRDEAARRRTAEQERDALRAQLESKDKPAEELALEAARREARAETLATANARIVAAEIRAAAAGKMVDPSDALRLLDTSLFEVAEDGSIDADAIASAIADLIKSKPYLAAQPQRRPAEGSADGGARKADTSKPRQLNRADLTGMTPQQIEAARAGGQLADLLAGKS